MRKLLAVVALVAFAAPALAADTMQAEKLVLNATAVRVDIDIAQRKAVEVQNLGPNAIYCALNTSTVTLLKARKIDTQTAWALDLPPHVPIYCKAASADQVTLAATIVTETR